MSSLDADDAAELTPSQTRKRLIRDIQADLEQFDQDELLGTEDYGPPEQKRSKLEETDDNTPHSSTLLKNNSSISSSSTGSTNRPPTAGRASPPKSDSSPDNHASAPSSPHGSEINGNDPHSNHNGIHSTADDSFLDVTIDMDSASHYLARLSRKCLLPYKTTFPAGSAPSTAPTSSAPPATLSSSNSKGVASIVPYKVTRVHHSKSAAEFERFKTRLSNSNGMVILSYTTNGDVAKEFSSTRGSRDLPKGMMVPPTNVKEQIQMAVLRIDDDTELFELEIAPQTSNAFAMMAGGAQRTSAASVVQPHLDIIISILKRKIIPASHLLIVYNAQRLIRLIQVTFKTIRFYSFEEPPFDPFVAGFVINPEMGVEQDEERTALSMRAYEYEGMLRKFCGSTASKILESRPKNVLADDTYHTRDIVLAIIQKLQEEELVEACMFEMRVAVLLAHMETPGMRIDLNYLAEPRKAINTKLKDLTQQACVLLGHDVLLSSPSQVASAVYNGLETYLSKMDKPKKSALRLTHSGKHPSTNEAALLELKKRMRADGMTSWKQYKIVDIVLEHRPIHKLLSFLEAVEQTAEPSKDPRFRVVFPRWLQCNTGTGRITCSSPNMQTQPTTDEIRLLATTSAEDDPEKMQALLRTTRMGSAIDAHSAQQAIAAVSNSSESTAADASLNSVSKFEINIRSAYVSRPGYTLVGADYSQIEMRILAQVSNDEELIQYFKSGMDIHRQVASRVFKCSLDQVTSQQREWCKRIVYGIVYGMGVQALSKSLDITSARGREFYDSFMGSFPKVQHWIANARGYIRSTFMTRTMLGRIRRFQPGGSSDQGQYLRQGVNTTIQGSAADIVKLAMVAIDTELFEAELSANLLLQIHDELIYEVKDEDVETFKVIMKRCMEGAAPDFEVPFVINIETGTSWGLMKP